MGPAALGPSFCRAGRVCVLLQPQWTALWWPLTVEQGWGPQRSAHVTASQPLHVTARAHDLQGRQALEWAQHQDMASCSLLVTGAHILHDQQVGAHPLWAKAGAPTLQASIAAVHLTPSWAVIAGRQVLQGRGSTHKLRGLDQRRGSCRPGPCSMTCCPVAEPTWPLTSAACAHNLRGWWPSRRPCQVTVRLLLQACTAAEPAPGLGTGSS